MTAATGLPVIWAGRALLVEVVADSLSVSLADGRPLDPKAAEVLMALGGDPPEWLGLVEGLEAVHRLCGGSAEALRTAADVLGQDPRDRAHLARTTSDEVVLVALAARGEPGVAANPACTIAAWDLIASHRSEAVRTAAGELGAVLPPVLASHRDLDVKARVARNPTCSSQVLARLATVPADAVQVAVASNPSTDEATLERLSQLWDSPVGHSLARNPRSPVDVLRRLAGRPDIAVRSLVAANPAYPAHLASRLMWDKSGRVRYQLAGRTDLSGRALGWVERYARRDGEAQYRMTRARLALNPASPPELLLRLDAIDAQLQDRQRPLLPWRRMLPSFLSLLGSVVAVAAVLVGIIAMLGGGDPAALITLLGGLVLVGAVVLVRRSTRVSRPSQPEPRLAPPTPRMVAMWVLLGGLTTLALVAARAGNPATFVGPAFLGARIVAEKRKSAAKR
ncbi:MAG: hypothetical protein QOE93_1360 [Actinomycetota bacterium]|jgi:hypothetical protein|nr:hypothetical protein [Actinomycetota bacterium]